MTPFHLNNKTILVTGASSGIGRQVAISISEMGGNVVLSGRKKAELEVTLSNLTKGNHQIYAADLLDETARKELVKNIPTLDGIVNSAGVVKPFPIKFITQEKIDETLNINYEIPLLLMAELTKSKKINKNASIVFMSSISGQHPHLSLIHI